MKTKPTAAQATDKKPSAVTLDPQGPVVEQPTAARTSPTPLELATLAATLAQGRPVGDDDVGELVRKAMLLLNASRKHLEDLASREAHLEEMKRRDEKRFGEIKVPTRWPASLDDFLRLVVGGKRESERLVIYRQHLGHLKRVEKWRSLPDPYAVDFDSIPGPSLVEISELVERDRKTGFSEHEYNRRATAFVDWRTKTQKAARVKKAKVAARAQHGLDSTAADKSASKHS